MIYISAHPHDKGQRVMRRQIAGRTSVPGHAVRVRKGTSSDSCLSILKIACSRGMRQGPICIDVAYTATMRMARHLLHRQRGLANSAGNTRICPKNLRSPPH